MLCLVPPTGLYIREDRCQTPIDKLKTIALRPPIDLMYGAAAFETAGAEVRLKDYPAERGGWDQLESDLRVFQPNVILLSITTPSLGEDLDAAALAKQLDPEVMTIAKGAHFNVLDEPTLERYPALDVALRGEYEHTCRELGEGWPLEQIAGITWRDGQGRIRRNADRPLEPELDRFTLPARHLVRNELYLRPDTGRPQTTLVTNRGCPHRCIYCLSGQVSGLRNRYRTVENVMNEIRECLRRYGIRNFLFRSDLFTQNKQWVCQLCEAILTEGLDIEWASNSRVDTVDEEMLKWMKRAGCWIIAYGVERGDQASLDRLRKSTKVEDAIEAIQRTRRAGIKSSAYLLMGLPWDTEELIEEQVTFAKRLDPDFLEVFFVYPFPGTELYQMAVEEGLLEAGEIPREAYGGPAMASRYLSVEELERLRRQALRRYYLRPRIIGRTLAGVRSPRELAGYVIGGMNMLRTILAR